jgi:hypothetical protein
MSRLSIFAAAAVLPALAATPAAFAKDHHHVRKAPQHINIFRLSQDYAVPRWSYPAPQPLVHHDAPPSLNDPSKFGGPTALPIQYD